MTRFCREGTLRSPSDWFSEPPGLLRCPQIGLVAVFLFIRVDSIAFGESQSEDEQFENDLETDPPNWQQLVGREVLLGLKQGEIKRQEVINGEFSQFLSLFFTYAEFCWSRECLESWCLLPRLCLPFVLKKKLNHVDDPWTFKWKKSLRIFAHHFSFRLSSSRSQIINEGAKAQGDFLKESRPTADKWRARRDLGPPQPRCSSAHARERSTEVWRGGWGLRPLLSLGCGWSQHPLVPGNLET